MTKTTIERELELIDGMIEVQLHHAEQCDRIANRTMAEKQKAWDMERVALLRKMRAALAAQPAEPVAQDRDAALNILARMFHHGEEIEGDDGAAMMVDMATWNEGCEALESLVGEDGDEYAALTTTSKGGAA